MAIEEALDETSFQFASAEIFRCPNGCGELSYDRHDKVSEESKKIAAVLGVLLIVVAIIFYQSWDSELLFWVLLLSAIAFGYFLIATG